MNAQQIGLSAAGVAAVGAGVALGALMAAESGTPGAFGFPLLLALPGLALIGKASTTFSWLGLLALASLATLLLGLDVTDSARTLVVRGGYTIAAASLAVLVAATALLRRRTLR